MTQRYLEPDEPFESVPNLGISFGWGPPRPNLPETLTEAQLDGRACVRCGIEDQPMRPAEAWSEQSAQLFECVDAEACSARAAGDKHVET